MGRCMRLVLIGLAVLAHTTGVAQSVPESFAIETPNGVDERIYLDVNGTQQFVMIRGEDRKNPVLLYLHGGPGAAFSLFAWKNFSRAGWERHFTVVHWDQPGAGRSFVKAGGKIDSSLTIERVAQDGVVVAEQVAKRLGHAQVVLVAGSWGTVVGIPMIKARPDLFRAYVATAQVVNKPQDEILAYDQVLAKARGKSDEVAIKELQTSGPPPYKSVAQFRTQRKWATAYENMPALDIQREVSTTPGTTPADLQPWYAALMASEAHFRGNDMKGPAATIDVRKWGSRFEVPVLFIHGSEDDITPLQSVRAYFEWIEAPSKKLLVIEGGGHNVAGVRAEEFLQLLRSNVTAAE